mmetsp:Transcript_28295/g.57943  ORF Transcript_28295/g.57943 Transcript_28295/m.57943 type:complete len:291 (+) Transcript_28295:149-1021(+)
MMAPLLESRSRVQSVSGASWSDLESGTRFEPFLLSGEALRERQSGRLDLLMPHTLPFNHSAVVINSFVVAVLREVFDKQKFELKSVHAIASLIGTSEQNWHRDSGPLFPINEQNGSGALAEEAGSNLGVYAVNAFVALDDVPLEAGPTQYLLGSHTLSNAQIQTGLSVEHEAAAFAWPQGSVVLMDYRTIHRGGANISRRTASTRLLAMLVYGRPWWRDAVNYQNENYGGVERVPVEVPAHGGGVADNADSSIVARRVVQRMSGTDLATQEANARAMYENCQVLWGPGSV